MYVTEPIDNKDAAIPKRPCKVVVISDVHLGTYGCHARELYNYLHQIKPETLILNGDILDIWQFKKSFFPKDHIKVIQYILKLALEGTRVYYITGNHDDLLRKFSDFSSPPFYLCDKLILDLDEKKYWIFHGDVFDVSVTYTKFLAKLGGKSYDLLIRLNRLVNALRRKLGKPEMSFAQKIKQRVKSAVKAINDFEQTAMDLAIEQKYDYVICGHIHRPLIKEYENKNGKVCYMNSGDWLDNLTALEYADGKWELIFYKNSPPTSSRQDEEDNLGAKASSVLIDAIQQLHDNKWSYQKDDDLIGQIIN